MEGSAAQAEVPRKALDAVVIRFAGDSGDGIQLTGGQFAQVTALAGNDLTTFPDFPAEIRAPAGTTYGVSAFQINFGGGRIMTAGDRPDVLVALNPAALMVNPEMRSLRETLYRHLSRLPLDPLPMTEEVVAGWEALSSDSHSKRINATWVARFAIEFYRSVLRVLSGADDTPAIPEVAKLCGTLAHGDWELIDRVASMLDRCLDAERDPMANVMLPLALEAFIDDLARRSRVGTT